MPFLANNYELFNFEDPICAAVRSLIDADVILPREETARDNIYTAVRFTAGTATGHVHTAPDGVKVYDSYTGAQLEITVSRTREDVETVATEEPTDTTAHDMLTLRVAKIRHLLRHAKTTASDHLPINDALSSPKITRLQPAAALSGFDAEMFADFVVLTWAIDYHIPTDIWPRVVLGDDGYTITGDDGENLTGD